MLTFARSLNTALLSGAVQPNVISFVWRECSTFLMWLACRTGHVGASLEYGDLLASYNVLHLGARRAQHDVLFLLKVFKGFIASSFLLQCFGLHVPARPARTVNRSLFCLPFAWVGTVQSGLFLRVPRTVNHFLGFCEGADVFYDSLGQLKRQSLAYVSTLAPILWMVVICWNASQSSICLDIHAYITYIFILVFTYIFILVF